MRTLNLQYALTARGLRATDECDFYMDRTLNTIDYKGELTRRQRLLQPRSRLERLRMGNDRTAGALFRSEYDRKHTGR